MFYHPSADVGLSYILAPHYCPFHSPSVFFCFFFSSRFLCNGRLSNSSSPSKFSTKSNHSYQPPIQMASHDLEGGRRRSGSATFYSMCCAWFSCLIWTILGFLLIFGIAFFVFVRSNVPEVKVHRIDVYKLNVTEPENKNKDTQLAIDVQIMVNVTNHNKKMTLVCGGLDVETMIEGYSLPHLHLKGFRLKMETSRDLKIRPQKMRSAVNDDDAKELKSISDQHEMELDLKMKGRVELWYNGRMISKLRLKVSCNDIEQSQIDQAIAAKCNVRLSPFRMD